MENVYVVNVFLIIFFFGIVLNSKKIYYSKLPTNYIKILLLFVCVVIIGSAGSLINGLQPIKTAILDLFLFSRFIIAYIFISFCLDKKEKVFIYQVIIKGLKIITWLNFCLLVLNLVFQIFPIHDVRFGIASQKLMYSHPVYLATTSYIAWVILSKQKNATMYIVMSIVLILVTMRSKIIILLSTYFLFKLFQHISKKASFILQLLGGISVIGLLSISFQQTIYYKLINTETAARSLLVTNALKIAKRHFPFGSGFGTYGSYASFINYSPLYQTLGMNKRYGFVSDHFSYGMDSYVSMLLAQFGFMGTVMFLLLIVYLLMNFYLQKSETIECNKIMIILFIISSFFTESLFNTELGIFLFIIFGLCNTTVKIKHHVDL